MSGPKDGGPAFPVVAPTDFQFVEVGMSLRDWFAGQALVGFIACPHGEGAASDFAEWSYQYADAMLAERAKSQ